MYKNRYVVLMVAFVGTLTACGQSVKPASFPLSVAGLTPVYAPNQIRTGKPAVFTAHLLADKVEPGKKHAYVLLIEGQKVSLPYPTMFQTQFLWQWRTDHPAFRFAVGSCTYVSEPEVV